MVNKEKRRRKQVFTTALVNLSRTYDWEIYLPSTSIHIIQRLPETAEVRVETHESRRSLKESFATGFICQPIQRALTVTCRQPAAVRQRH